MLQHADAAERSKSLQLSSPRSSASAYTLDVWGGTRRQVEAADALAEVAEFQREAVYLTLTSNIALAAISEASLRGQIAATQRIIGLQTNLLGIMRKQATPARSRCRTSPHRRRRSPRRSFCCRRWKSSYSSSVICCRF